MFKSNMIWVNRYSKRFFCKPSYKEQINACCCRRKGVEKCGKCVIRNK